MSTKNQSIVQTQKVFHKKHIAQQEKKRQKGKKTKSESPF
jgi:hypothetical protein